MIETSTADSLSHPSAPLPENPALSALHATLRATEQLKQLSAEDLRSIVQLASQSSLIDDPADVSAFLMSLATSLMQSTAEPIEETARPALPARGEPVAIALENVLFVPKLSKVQWDLAHNRMSYDSLLAEYRAEGLDTERIVAAHNAHSDCVAQLKNQYPTSQWLHPLQLNKATIDTAITAADLVVVVGGDDHFKYMNQFLDSTFVAIVNSDTDHSDGVAAYFNARSIQSFLEQAELGNFLVEEWQRLSVTVKGKQYPTAVSEIAVAEERFKFGSRGSSSVDGKEMPFKGSGIIVGTGYGSRGWLQSAARYIRPQLKPWARTAAHAHWVEREPYGDVSYPHITNGALEPGQSLTITSNLKHNGLLTIDSIIDIPFPRGAKATIGFADAPIKVLRSL